MRDGCPRCGGNLDVEKDSFSGEVWRSYYCHACGWKEDVNEGTAMWKVISDFREAEEAERAGKPRQPQRAVPAEPPPDYTIPPDLRPATGGWRRKTLAAVVLALLVVLVVVFLRT